MEHLSQNPMSLGENQLSEISILRWITGMLAHFWKHCTCTQEWCRWGRKTLLWWKSMPAACCRTHSPAWSHWTERHCAPPHHPCSSYAVCSYSSSHSTSQYLRNSPETKRDRKLFTLCFKHNIFILSIGQNLEYDYSPRKHIFDFKDSLQTCSNTIHTIQKTLLP